jgi:hypothetical protein
MSALTAWLLQRCQSQRDSALAGIQVPRRARFKGQNEHEAVLLASSGIRGNSLHFQGF